MDIEEIGASYLRKVISYSSYLKVSILTKDKTPSWDGEIFAYKYPECKKEDLYGKAPIQVKTKRVKEFNNFSRTFSISVKDLRNYFNDGGCIFFVIETKNREEIIFVRDLLPSDIKELLAKADKSSQKSISVSLKRLDTTSSIELENLCKNFILNRSIQFSTKDCPLLRHEDAIETKIHFIAKDVPIENYLLTHEVPLYGRRIPEEAERFIAKIKIHSLNHTINEKITIGGESFYENYEVIKKEKEIIYKFGNEIFIEINSQKLKFHFAGSIDQQIYDTKFLLKLIEYKDMAIGGKGIALNNIENEKENKTQLEKSVKALNDIKTLLEYFKIDPCKLDLNTLDENSYKNLKVLLKIFVYKLKIEENPFMLGINVVKIGNLQLGILVYKNKERKTLIIRNLFEDLTDYRLIAKTDNEEFQISPYVILKSDFLTLIDNINLDLAYQNIKKIVITDNFGDLLNLFGLELIKAYDNTGRIEFIQIAEKIFLLLQEEGKKSQINKINELQIHKRLRKLTNEEISQLLGIRDNFANDSYILCGVNILLENKTDAINNFNEMKSDNKKEFIEYPIYTLAKQMGIDLV